MYCPKCGNLANAEQRFCKSCGTDLLSVSQALANPAPPPSAPLGPRPQTAPGPVVSPLVYSEIADGYKMIGSGVGFLLGALAVLFLLRQPWAVWIIFGLLIAGCGSLAKGIGAVMAARALRTAVQPPPPATTQPPLMPPAPQTRQPDYQSPSSVTEHTTRHLGQ
jgi:hypothetical protein